MEKIVAIGQQPMMAALEKMRLEAAGSPMASAVMTPASLDSPAFSSVLKQAVEHVDRLQHQANEQQRAVEMGESDDLTRAMLESQQASVAFSALIQVRNRLTSAFEETINLPL